MVNLACLANVCSRREEGTGSNGADPVDQRPDFAEMLQRLAANGAKTIIIESPDRFARDSSRNSPGTTC